MKSPSAKLIAGDTNKFSHTRLAMITLRDWIYFFYFCTFLILRRNVFRWLNVRREQSAMRHWIKFMRRSNEREAKKWNENLTQSREQLNPIVSFNHEAIDSLIQLLFTDRASWQNANMLPKNIRFANVNTMQLRKKNHQRLTCLKTQTRQNKNKNEAFVVLCFIIVGDKRKAKANNFLRVP